MKTAAKKVNEIERVIAYIESDATDVGLKVLRRKLRALVRKAFDGGRGGASNAEFKKEFGVEP